MCGLLRLLRLTRRYQVPSPDFHMQNEAGVGHREFQARETDHQSLPKHTSQQLITNYFPPMNELPTRPHSPATRTSDQKIATPACNCPLLQRLPTELRLRIYEYVLFDNTTNSTIYHISPHFHEPSLLRTCAQIRREAEPIFYNDITHALVYDHSHEAIAREKKWRASIGKRRAGLVKDLQLAYVAPMLLPFMEFLDLMQTVVPVPVAWLPEDDWPFAHRLLDELIEAGFDVERLTFEYHCSWDGTVGKVTVADTKRFEAWKESVVQARGEMLLVKGFYVGVWGMKEEEVELRYQVAERSWKMVGHPSETCCCS